jgi:protein-S-isoprenylcysteine O-methyltransferase Ste14
VNRLVVAALFTLVALAAGIQTIDSFANLIDDPTLRSWAVAGYSLLKTGVAAAFSVFVLVRGPSRRPSRDPVAFAACAIAIGAVIALQRPSESAATSLVLAGELVTLVFCGWLLVSALTLGRCFGILPEVRGLVMRGPYRLVRHPVYLGELGACAGLVLASPTPWNLGVAAAFTAAQATRIRLEERALLGEFPEYAEYAATTPRLVPRMGGFSMARRLQRAMLVVVSLLAAGLLVSSGAVARTDARLKAPVPTLPAPGAQVALVPSFAWNPVKGAERYEFQIAADAGFNAPVLGTGNDRFFTRNTRATLRKTIPNGVYWWRVRASKPSGAPSPWSAGRSIRKAWTARAALQAPSNGSVVSYPLTPLKLLWSSVPGAASYLVTIATDPLLGSAVSSYETQATSLTRPGALSSGTYYWGITPLDAQGNKGTPSEVWSFVWFWPSATTPRFADLAAEPEVVDPQFSWDPLPGAARYEVEVSSSQDFAPGSRVCCSTQILGSSHSPERVFRDNVYYWRVRAFDPDGNAGIWNEGPQFAKRFDKVPPVAGTSIKSVRMRDNERDPGLDLDASTSQYETDVPVITWTPVTGASSYQVEVAPMGSTDCNWTAAYSHWVVNTSVNAWTPLGSGWNGHKPYPDAAPVANDAGTALIRHMTYCTRVRARSNRDSTGNDVYGDYTYMVNGVASPNPGPSFTWVGFPAGEPCLPVCNAGYLGAGNYLLPAHGTLNTRTPYFTWKPLPRPRVILDNTSSTGAFMVIKQKCATLRIVIREDSGNPSNDEFVVYEALGNLWLTREVFEYPDANLNALASQVNSNSDFVSGRVLAGGPLMYQTDDAFEGKMSYFVLVAKDAQFSNIVDYAFTQLPAYSPRGITRPTSYSDETTSYYWVVLPANLCNGDEAVGTPLLGAPRSFEKRSISPTLLAPGNGSTILEQPTFRWTAAEGARRYRLQVSQDPTFGDPIEDVFTDATAYTTSTTYPADTVLYWRVRADDENVIGLTWSVTGTFQRRLPVPALSPSNPTRGDFIPTWTWSSITGAVSYDVAADLPDGTHRNITGLRTAALTPIIMYGTGLFHWKVRANYPKAPFGSVPGPYSATMPFTRTIGEPSGAHADASDRHVLLSWEPKPGVKGYRVQISARPDFAVNVENITTDNTSYAPVLMHPAYVARKTLYWRVAGVDQGNNVGDYTPTQQIGAARRMRLAVRGRAARNRSTTVIATVRDLSGTRLKGATVRVSGAGMKPRAARTGASGSARLTIRPTRRGKVTFRATKTGYSPAMLTTRVR